MPVGGVYDHGIHPRFYKGIGPFRYIGSHPDGGGHPETAILVFIRDWLLAKFGNIPEGDQANQFVVAVHYGQLFDLILLKDVLRFGQGGPFANGDEVFGSHNLRNGPFVVLFKPEVAVGTIPINRLSLSTIGIPPIPCSLMQSLAS